MIMNMLGLNEVEGIAQECVCQYEGNVEETQLEGTWSLAGADEPVYEILVMGIAKSWVLAGPRSWVDNRWEQLFKVHVSAEDGAVLGCWREEHAIVL